MSLTPVRKAHGSAGAAKKFAGPLVALQLQVLLHEISGKHGRRAIDLSEDFEAMSLIKFTGLEFIGVDPHGLAIARDGLCFGALHQARANTCAAQCLGHKSQANVK